MEDVRAVPDDKSIFTEKWTADRVPDQSGRLVIVTGTASGPRTRGLTSSSTTPV
jgi:hypothetical protein